MFTYAWYQWLAFFYIYCFCGWIFESAYVSLKSRRLVNRGFLRLPMLPLYGTGAIMMLWVSIPVQDNLLLVYLSGFLAATALEYVTGWTMERLFKMRYWDYSDQPFNINGYVCLGSSIAWGFLTILLTEVIHKPLERFVLDADPTVELCILAVVTVLFVTDTIQSVKAALDLGRALEAMTKMKAELEEMQVQLALLKAEAADRAEAMRSEAVDRAAALRDEAEAFRNETADRAEILRNEAVDRAAALRDDMVSRAVAFMPKGAVGDMTALVKQLSALYEKRNRLANHSTFYRRRLLRDNPTAFSKRFEDALKELRKNLE